jgi:hypothetical protein
LALESTFAQALNVLNRYLHNFRHGHLISYSVNWICPISRYKRSKKTDQFHSLTPSLLSLYWIYIESISNNQPTINITLLQLKIYCDNRIFFSIDRLIGEVISSSIPIYLFNPIWLGCLILSSVFRRNCSASFLLTHATRLVHFSDFFFLIQQRNALWSRLFLSQR